jgi:DNA (cytosine-5)-methyltransferase 1
LEIRGKSKKAMTIFPRLSTAKIGRNKDAPRVWLEGRYLLQAGFIPSHRIQVHFSEQRVEITLAAEGVRVVSSKTRHNQSIPVLDLNTSALADSFGPITTLQVTITEGSIVLSPTQTERLRSTRCRNGKEGSVFAGGGLLTEAARLAGYQPAFAIELNEQYAKVFEENHNAMMFNLSIEDVPIGMLPAVELLTLGLPCEPFSMAARVQKGTGKKRDKTLPPEAHPLGDLTVWAALVIRALNPATVVIEEAPGYLNSGAGFMMRLFLERAGYTVEARVIDPREHGELTARSRTVIVAHSGSDFQWPEPVQNTRTFAEIRDDESGLEDRYFTAETKPWLTNHWANQTAKGNGFTSTQLDDQSTSVPCISKRYFAGQGTGAVVKNKSKTATWRWLTLSEARKLHGIPSTYRLAAESESTTLAGEIIGQGVIVTFFQKIIAATRNLGTKQVGESQLSAKNYTAPDQTERPQLGFCFA